MIEKLKQIIKPIEAERIIGLDRVIKPGRPSLHNNDERYTPKDFIDKLLNAGNKAFNVSGNFLFDLDPASSVEANNLVKIAKRIYTKETDGLKSEWGDNSYVFMNPPFTHEPLVKFVKKFAEHNNGILLTFEKASVPTKELILPNCYACLHFKKIMEFVDKDGQPVGKKNGSTNQWYTVLYAFGEKAFMHLLEARKTLSDYEPYLMFTEKGMKKILIDKEREV